MTVWTIQCGGQVYDNKIFATEELANRERDKIQDDENSCRTVRGPRQFYVKEVVVVES